MPHALDQLFGHCVFTVLNGLIDVFESEPLHPLDNQEA
jgi:hypothetical protein